MSGVYTSAVCSGAAFQVAVCEACSMHMPGPQAHGICGDSLCVCSLCTQQASNCKLLCVV